MCWHTVTTVLWTPCRETPLRIDVKVTKQQFIFPKVGVGRFGLHYLSFLPPVPYFKRRIASQVTVDEGVASQESVTLCWIVSEGGKSNQTASLCGLKGPADDRVMHSNDSLR